MEYGSRSDHPRRTFDRGSRNRRAIVTCNGVGRSSDIVCLFLRSTSYVSSYLLHRPHPIRLRNMETTGLGDIFPLGLAHRGDFSGSVSPESCTRKSEEATRQQGGLFFRENSSNGGKAIRTFWRNTKFGKIPCQGQNWLVVSLW